MRDRSLTRRVHSSSRVTTVVVLALALVLSACGDSPQSALDPQGPYAQEPHDLIVYVFWIAAVVFVLVQGLIIVSIVRFRRRDEDDDGSLPVQVHGNTRLEIFWTVVPAVILAAIAVPTVQMIFSISDEPEDPDTLTVEVIGHRWWWEFYYPEYDIYTANEMAIPTETPVRLEMTAADPARSVDEGVLHSFWIPPLAGKQDVVPGQTTFLNMEANEPGRYLGQCAEYCGLSHVNMRARVVAMEPGDGPEGFDTWVDNQQQPAVEPEEGSLAAEGARLFGELGDGRQSCVACHQVFNGEGERSPMQGPDLTHFASREEFAGAIVERTDENLRRWLDDPSEVKPMRPQRQLGMPDLNLEEDEIDALVAYLQTLE